MFQNYFWVTTKKYIKMFSIWSKYSRKYLSLKYVLNFCVRVFPLLFPSFQGMECYFGFGFSCNCFVYGAWCIDVLMYYLPDVLRNTDLDFFISDSLSLKFEWLKIWINLRTVRNLCTRNCLTSGAEWLSHLSAFL